MVVTDLKKVRQDVARLVDLDPTVEELLVILMAVQHSVILLDRRVVKVRTFTVDHRQNLIQQVVAVLQLVDRVVVVHGVTVDLVEVEVVLLLFLLVVLSLSALEAAVVVAVTVVETMVVLSLTHAGLVDLV